MEFYDLHAFPDSRMELHEFNDFHFFRMEFYDLHDFPNSRMEL